jgi:hypothetical protein
MQQQQAAMQQQQAAMQPQLAAMQQQQAAMQQQQAAMQQQQAVLVNRTSAALATARRLNSYATQPTHQLTRVPHPDTGAAPPAAFPNTVDALKRYSAQNCAILMNFYGLGQVPDGLAAKRTAIGHHIGCPIV